MRVVLYAPTIASEWGGVWQFTQLALRELRGLTDYGLVGSRELVDEVSALGLAPPGEATICFDALLAEATGGSDAERASLAQSRLVERLAGQKTDLLHVPIQLICDRPITDRFPYILNPHDYQHEYFPEFFTQADIEGRRRVWYPTQRQAAALVVHSKQTLDDALRFLGVPEERVFYAPYGPLESFEVVDHETVERVRARLGLPERYLFYPARMWPHKNHVALVRALAVLKRRGIDIACVFTDDQTPHAAVVRQVAEDEGVADRVLAVGRVTPSEMSALYQGCLMVVVPSLFEQNSGPMLEAIHFERPVAVSNLPELVETLDGQGDVFDARSVDEIVATLERFLGSDERQREAVERIRALKARMSWEPFREAYRRAYEYALSGR